MLAVGQALRVVHAGALPGGQWGVRHCGLFKYACAHGALPAGGPTGGHEQSVELLREVKSPFCVGYFKQWLCKPSQ